MRNELKRLIMGFIYSLMTVSFIMSPIPFIGFNNAYAEGLNTERSKIYKKGENVDEIVQKAQMKNYTDEAGGLKAMIEQAVVGMMAVNLLSTLRFNYLYKVNPILYGNDCKANKAAKITMRIAQLSALMYIIGDVSANMGFKKAAKKAADELEGFNPTEKTNFENMSDEEKEAWEEANEGQSADRLAEDNKQIGAFNKLIEILQGQEKALKKKKAMNMIATLGYGINTGIEVANIIKCKMQCTTLETLKNSQEHMMFQATLNAAIAQAQAAAAAGVTAQGSCLGTCAPALVTQTAACQTLVGSLGAWAAKFGVELTKDNATAVAKEAARVAKDTAETVENVTLFQKIGQFFNPENVENSPLSVENPTQAAMEADPNYQLVSGIPIADTVDDAEAGAVNGANAASTSAVGGTAQGTSAPIVAQAMTCSALGLPPAPLVPTSVGMAIKSYTGYAFKPVECCGGDGLSKAGLAQAYTVFKVLNAQADALAGGAASAQAMGEVAAEIAKDQGIALAIDKAKDLAVQNLVSSFGDMGQIVQGAYSEMVEGNDGALGSDALDSMAEEMFGPDWSGAGTLIHHGVPKTGQLHRKKDIRVLGLFEKSGAEYTPEEREHYEGMKYYTKHNFESILRRFALAKRLSLPVQSKEEELRVIAENDQNISNIMFFFNQIVEETPNLGDMNMAQMRKHRYWDTIISMIGNAFLPKAHAFLSGGMGMAAGGMALTMVAGMLDLPPFWSAILNVGAQFMLIQGLLGKIGKNWAFVKPIGRSITWGLMTGILILVNTWDKKALDKVKERIKLIEDERAKYIASSARSGIGAGEGYQAGQYQANSYQANAQNGGEAFIKQCAVPAGEGFKPASCPQKTTKSAFDVPKVDKVTAKLVSPDSFRGMATVSNLSSKTSNGNLSDGDLSDSNLAAIEKQFNAIKARNDGLIKGLDNLEKKQFRNKKNKPSSLAKTIAAARNAISGNVKAIEGSLASFGSNGSPNVISNKKDKGDNGVVTASGSKAGGSAGGAATPAAGGFNLDLLGDEFGDDSAAGGDGSADGATAAKAEENLNDFEINHDDINKKKEVSIFKILSNRYILSYPKVLEEEVVGAPDAKGEPEAKVDLEKQLEEMKQ
tara:strand:- start:20447 stop:23788 length:3342 start_codon:yes stop_codon:yes gene_type:complete